MALVDRWPLFGLRVVSDRLALRYPDDELTLAIAELATRGVHDPAVMPFQVPWTDAPAADIPRNSLQFHWRARAELTAEDWHLPFVAVVDGEVLGTQSLIGKQFAARRGVESGSWVARERQGRGIGTEMRRLVLHLAFGGLGAAFAETAAWHDNDASLGVTRRLGYVPAGETIELRRGEPTCMRRFRMDRSRWASGALGEPPTIEGLDACLDLLGARTAPSVE